MSADAHVYVALSVCSAAICLGRTVLLSESRRTLLVTLVCRLFKAQMSHVQFLAVLS